MPEVTYRELIKEIKELKTELSERMKSLENCIDERVTLVEFSEYKNKTNSLWDERNKIVGYVIGGGAVGGMISSGMGKIITEVMAKL